MSEVLCSWFAHPAAWAGPDERPSPHLQEAVPLALAELWVGRALCVLGSDPEALPFSAETALRSTASDQMDLDGWLGVFDALLAVGAIDDPQATHEDALRAANDLGCAPTLHAMLTATGAGDVPASFVKGLVGMVSTSTPLRAAPLCWVRNVTQAGKQTTIHYRELVGTSYPVLQSLKVEHPPPMPEDQLVFWDGDQTPIVVPRWLAHWDETSRQVRWYAGRDVRGRAQYRGWRPHDMVATQMPDDAPLFLRDQGTPDPAETTGAPNLSPTAAGAPGTATHPMLAPRMALPIAGGRTAPFAEADPLVLRVLTTRYVLRFVRIETGTSIIIGRNADHASFVLHHHQVSRAHTQVRERDGQVWVSDAGSTNGTQVNNVDAGRSEVVIHPGDVIAAGPILLRLERVPEKDLARLEQVTNLKPSPTRDPLSRLLLPRFLGDALDDPLKATFKEGGTPADAPSLWGVILRVDRMHAMHAQHGEQVADGAFAITARLIQGIAPAPLMVVRLGYGEILIPLIGADAQTAEAHAALCVRTLRDQPWEPPLHRVTLTAAIGRKELNEGASTWVARIRKAMEVGLAATPQS